MNLLFCFLLLLLSSCDSEEGTPVPTSCETACMQQVELRKSVDESGYTIVSYICQDANGDVVTTVVLDDCYAGCHKRCSQDSYEN